MASVRIPYRDLKRGEYRAVLMQLPVETRERLRRAAKIRGTTMAVLVEELISGIPLPEPDGELATA